MTTSIIKHAIGANIGALGDMLRSAVRRAEEAEDAIVQGEQNQAIGTILNLDEYLENALALYRAAIALHRYGS